MNLDGKLGRPHQIKDTIRTVSLVTLAEYRY